MWDFGVHHAFAMQMWSCKGKSRPPGNGLNVTGPGVDFLSSFWEHGLKISAQSQFLDHPYRNIACFSRPSGVGVSVEWLVWTKGCACVKPKHYKLADNFPSFLSAKEGRMPYVSIEPSADSLDLFGQGLKQTYESPVMPKNFRYLRWKYSPM